MSKKQKKHKPSPISYRQRKYRQMVNMGGLAAFEVMVGETDLHIIADRDLKEVSTHLVQQYRNQLENYIADNPQFLKSLQPLPLDQLAPKIVKEMLKSAQKAGVGPMASVAGTISEFIGLELIKNHGAKEIMVENGGDIFLQRSSSCTIAIYAGTSPLSNKVGIKVSPGQMPLGICTSSASIGHSLSLGQADAVTVLSASTPLADAVATRLGNETKEDGDINRVLHYASEIEGVNGVLIIKGDKLGAWGDLELVEI